MQTIVMIEMLRATAKFEPNGRPIDLDDEQYRVFLREKKVSQGRKSGRALCILGTALVQFVSGVHFRPNALRHAD